MITEITQLNRDDEGNRFLQPLSRRKLLGVGSTVAAALLTARAADAQQREKTQRGEGDHSASDPGPENQSLLKASEN
jgi:oxalate decarboxylase